MTTSSKTTDQGGNDERRLCRVFVRDLTLKALLGIHYEERMHPQRIIVNIDLTVKEGGDAMADDIANVVSYEIVVEKVERIVAQGHVSLIETLADRIARECLEDERVMVARVRIEKPDIIDRAGSVGVEIERRR
jgi:dihydroneopterin aldolase